MIVPFHLHDKIKGRWGVPGEEGWLRIEVGVVPRVRGRRQPGMICKWMCEHLAPLGPEKGGLLMKKILTRVFIIRIPPLKDV